MTLFHTHILIHAIPTGEDSAVRTSVEFLHPRSRHVVNLVLAIGADTISTLMERWQEKEAKSKAKGEGKTSEESPLFSEGELRTLLTSLLSDERADAFFAVVAHYLSIPKHEAELLSLEDLFVIGKKIADFFPDTARQIVETSGAMRSK